MDVSQLNTFEDLEQFLRDFINAADDPAPYDFDGAFHLFLAILANLAENSIDADLESLKESHEEDGLWITAKQQAFLKHIVQLA